MVRPWMALLTGLLLLFGPAARAREGGPGTLDLSSADYALRQFEKAVESAAGRKIALGHYGKLAQTQIEALRSRYPDHPKVMELVERLDAALLAARGDTIEVTPAMLAYRKFETKLVDVMAEISVKEWTARLAELREDDTALLTPFPAPDPRATPFSQLAERTVVLTGLHWPRDQFTNNGISHLFAGDSSRGFYFVKAEHPSFLAAYGAIKRYRDRVCRDVPDGWTIVGRIKSVRVMVPGAGRRAAARAHAGYVVEPTAIYVPGRVLAVSQGEGNGRFSGEERLSKLLAEAYSVTEIPEDVSPRRLIEIMAVAAKEKNFELFLTCLPESDRESPSKRHSIEYLWGQFQKRFAKDYVHIEVLRLEEIEARRPEHPDSPRVEALRAWVKAYNEAGEVSGAPRPVIMVRTGGGRWSVESGYPF